ncbi:hypothetical protein NQ315_001388 [Exocentrus adspersus]|uniref:Uncharacterized protein n=1 Tax=Exocentrus adspersus TaxID=1586481 RepID=A0AAV8WF45_9CUCU|nr:hypothetical protein NQ315_001388 [Exocentrus adspersus]
MKLLRLVLLLFCSLAVAQEACIPNPAGGVILSADRWLHWDPSENCPNTVYRVQVFFTMDKPTYSTVTAQLSWSMDFLLYCRVYNFTVTSLANNILGTENFVWETLHIPEGTDVVINGLTGALIDDSVLVEWRIGWKYPYCVEHFHFFIYDDEVETPQYLQVIQPGYLLEHVARCTNYRFEVASSYGMMNGTTSTINYTVPALSNRPTLVEVRQNAVSINTTWSLEKYNVNRCRVTALYVTGTRFNATYPIEDTPERPNVQVSITGLIPDSMYSFSVSIENSAGLSTPYHMAVQTLPLEATSD